MQGRIRLVDPEWAINSDTSSANDDTADLIITSLTATATPTSLPALSERDDVFDVGASGDEADARTLPERVRTSDLPTLDAQPLADDDEVEGDVSSRSLLTLSRSSSPDAVPASRPKS